MMLLKFQDRFVGKVIDGSKTHTVGRKSCNVGDTLQLARLEPVIFAVKTCVAVEPIFIWAWLLDRAPDRYSCTVMIDHHIGIAADFATADGFEDENQLGQFIIDTYDTAKFEGFLIHW